VKEDLRLKTKGEGGGDKKNGSVRKGRKGSRRHKRGSIHKGGKRKGSLGAGFLHRERKSKRKGWWGVGGKRGSGTSNESITQKRPRKKEKGKERRKKKGQDSQGLEEDPGKTMRNKRRGSLTEKGRKIRGGTR